jgi:predicted amidohydrolase
MGRRAEVDMARLGRTAAGDRPVPAGRVEQMAANSIERAPALRALLGQLAPLPGDSAANVARLDSALASHPSVDLAVFPELFLTGYEASGATAEAGDDLVAVADVARDHGTALIVGFAEGDGARLYDSVACVEGDGRVVAVYRKTHLFDREAERFSAGDSLVIAQLGGLRIGLLVCFDLEFPEPARALAAAGADLLATCSANMWPYGECHALCARVRALENGIPHVYCNRVGREMGMRFVGGSLAVDRSGVVVAGCGAHAEELIEVELPLGRAEPPVDYLRQTRGALPVSAVAERAVGELRGPTRGLGSEG